MDTTQYNPPSVGLGQLSAATPRRETEECNHAVTPSRRLTADDVIQEEIGALHRQIARLHALRASLPREMGHEADDAMVDLLLNRRG